MCVHDGLLSIIEEVDVLFAEIRELGSRGPKFRIVHRFHRPGSNCAPGEEIFAIYFIHRGREHYLRLSLALRILFDYLARHSRVPQSAAQIEAGIRADIFYTQHSTNATGRDKLTRGIPRSYVRVYIERFRSVLEKVFLEAGLLIDAHAVVVAEETVMNGVGYRLRASFDWIHIDI
jgi:hypothetical protein